MARYNKKKIFEQAKELVTKHRLLFVEDIVSFLPISKPTFYDYFTVDSDEFNTLRKLLDENKIAIKASLRAKWYNSDNATTQLALYRLVATPDEHQALNQHYISVDVSDKKRVAALFPTEEELNEQEAD